METGETQLDNGFMDLDKQKWQECEFSAEQSQQ